MNDLHIEIAGLRNLNRELYHRVAELESDLAECKINLREAEAKPKVKPHVDEYEAMLSRIGTMIPLEFFQTPESSTEQAVALLLHRYYDVMAEAMYTNAEKLGVQP